MVSQADDLRYRMTELKRHFPILCGEGVKDVKAVQQFLRKLKKYYKVVILPIGGDQLAVGERESELAELIRLSNNIFVLVDSEHPGADEEMPTRRKEFIN